MALVANNLAWVMLKEPAPDLPKALALANLAPAACARIRRAFEAGDLEQARRQQHIIAPLGAALTGGARRS